MLNEFDVDRLALTPERPSEALSDMTPASLVVANSLRIQPHTLRE